jgi:cation:H+ antiporter
VVFLGYYAAYTAYVILGAQRHDALPQYSAVMLWFVVPLTLLTLVITVVRELRGKPA